jgi:hypothetical protein
MKIYASLITILQLYVIIKFILTIGSSSFDIKATSIDIYSKIIIGGTVLLTTMLMCLDFFYVIKCVRGF